MFTTPHADVDFLYFIVLTHRRSKGRNTYLSGFYISLCPWFPDKHDYLTRYNTNQYHVCFPLI